MNTEKNLSLNRRHGNVSLLILMLALLPIWVGCSYTAKEKTIYLTLWLKERKQEIVSPLPMTNGYTKLSYTVKKVKKLWFFSYTTWEDLNYDIVTVLDDKRVLAGRSLYYAESLFGKNLKDSDVAAKLITESDTKGKDICSGLDRVRHRGPFIDCEDVSNKYEFVIRRMDKDGKEITQIRMDANRWTYLHTVTEIAFYDDLLQPYVLEAGKNGYCRLNLLTSEGIIIYEGYNHTKKPYYCSEAGFWSDKVREILRKP